MRTDRIESLIVDLSQDPFNPVLNFAVAQEYDRLKQTASAVSFYLRVAEYGTEEDKEIIYNSLLRMSICFLNQNDRIHTVSNCIFQALTVLPARPEAYFLLSQFHEQQGNWQECYTWAEVGLSLPDVAPLPADVGYYDRYCLEFEKAVSGWWIGRSEEARQLFHEILKNKKINKDYKNAIRNNLATIWKEQHA